MQAAVDAGPLFANLVEAHAERVLAQVRVADKLVESTYPENLAFILAARALADLVLRRRNDTLNARVAAATYVVPVDMPVSQVATNLYGSSVRGSELVALNGLSDPSRVRAGTSLTYYP
jgi:prophage DNA circulation protein